MSATAISRICLIVPCYNEQDVLPEFIRRVRRLSETLTDVQVETIYIDDGSTDATASLLATHAAEDPAMRVVVLSRNFGHQAAITAGIDHCDADGAIILDADLQDPPELAAEILRELNRGADVVHMVRAKRLGDSAAKRWSARAFYAFMRRSGLGALPENAGDFKGLSRRAVHALRQYPERIRFLRGLIVELGFDQVQLYYVRDPRFAGRSKYPWRRVVRFATDAILSHGPAPTRFLMAIGALSIAAAPAAPIGLGWNATALLVFLLMVYSGLGLLGLGIVGEYLSRILVEVKHRPLYRVKSTVNIAAPTAAVRWGESIEQHVRQVD